MDTKLLESLVAAHGVSGDEAEVSTLLESVCRSGLDRTKGDGMWKDAMGNLVIHRSGNGPKILLAGHMDSVGCVVTRFEKTGFLRFAPVGGLDPASILQAPVRFKNRVTGVISADEDKVGKALQLRDLYIDIGAQNEEEARDMVSLGDTAAFATPFLKYGHRVISPYLDNRAGCAAMVETLHRLRSRGADLYFAFTVQEELGMRGIGPVCYDIRPDYGICVDVTCPDDLPGPLHEGTTTLCKGAAIKVMDHSVLCSEQMIRKLKELSLANQIPCQMDLMSCGGTDAGPMHVSRGGILTGGVSIPCRYTHTPTERIHGSDYDAVVQLLTAFCEQGSSMEREHTNESEQSHRVF